MFPMIGVWKRNIYRGIDFCKSLAVLDPDKVSGEVEARYNWDNGTISGFSGAMIRMAGLQRPRAIQLFGQKCSRHAVG